MPDFDHVATWLDRKLMNEGCSPATIDKYRGYLLRLDEYLRSEHQVDLLGADPDHLLTFTGLHMHRAGLSPRSRQALVAAVKGFYRWALRQHLVTKDLVVDLEYPKAGRKLPNVAQLETIERLLMAPDLDTLQGVRDVTMMAMLAGCGLRRGGLCSLNESNLIWTNLSGKRRLIVRVTEKGNRQRDIPAPNDVWLLVRAYLGHPELAAIDRSLPDGDQVLFVSLNNRMVSPDQYHGETRRISARSVDDMIKSYGRKLGLPDKQLHAHAFRHAFGTQLAEDGTSLREIQDLLGHVDIKTTEIYTRLATERLAKTVDSSNPLAKIRTPVRGLENILEN